LNILIEDLDEKTVEKLKRQATERNRSLQADLKVIIEEAVVQREQSKVLRELGEKRVLQKDVTDAWQETWGEADRISKELRQSGQKFSDTTELLREDRER
jgi:plasmid stability protein